LLKLTQVHIRCPLVIGLHKRTTSRSPCTVTSITDGYSVHASRRYSPPILHRTKPSLLFNDRTIQFLRPNIWLGQYQLIHVKSLSDRIWFLCTEAFIFVPANHNGNLYIYGEAAYMTACTGLARGIPPEHVH